MMSILKNTARIARAYFEIKADEMESRAKALRALPGAGRGSSPGGGVVEPRQNLHASALVEREDVNVATAIRVIVNAIAGLPIVVRRREIGTDGSINYIEANDHEALEFFKRPNRFNTTKEIIRHNSTSVIMTGNAFTAFPKEKSWNGRREFWLLPSWTTRLSRNASGFPDRYLYSPDVKPIPFDLNEMIHCRLYNPIDPFYGSSPIEPLRRQLWTDYQAELFNLAFFKNDATPRTVFSPTHGASALQRLDLEQAFEDRQKDWANKHNMMILPEEGSIQVVTPSFTDMEFSTMRRFHRERVHGLIGIPPFLGGVMEYANYANALVQEASFWRHTMIPLGDLLVDYWTRQFLWEWFDDDHVLGFDYSGVQALQTDALKKAQTYVALSGGPVMTPNEARATGFNLEPIDGGEELRSNAFAGFGMDDTTSGDTGDSSGKIAQEDIDAVIAEIEQETDLSDDDLAAVREALRSVKGSGLLLQLGSESGALSRLAGHNGDRTKRLEAIRTIKHRWPAKRLKTEATDRQIYAWKAFDKRTMRFEDRYANAIAKYFREQRARVLELLDNKSMGGTWRSRLFTLTTGPAERTPKFHIDNVSDGGVLVARRLIREKDVDDVDAVINLALENEFLLKLLLPIIREIIEESGQLAMADFNIGGSFDVENPKVYAMIESFANRLTGINDATYTQLKRLLRRAYAEGLGVSDIARLIREKYSQFSSVRAKIIARTEMTGMVNGGGLEAYAQQGASHKEWIAALDSHTRDAHVQYNGEIVPIEEPFVHGGEAMMYPGDPSGSAWNVVNCRCALAPIFEEDFASE